MACEVSTFRPPRPATARRSGASMFSASVHRVGRVVGGQEQPERLTESPTLPATWSSAAGKSIRTQ